jgi:DNA-binding MarR family transcriptional regulator
VTGDALEGAFFGKFRASFDAIGADVARTLAELGLTDYRPRYSAVIRIVTAEGPLTIRHISRRMSTTHSASSQTISEMAQRGLVTLRSGADARERVVHLTAKARRLRPLIDAEWTATAAALRDLDAELSAPLATIAVELADALARRPFHERIADHLEVPERG